jgi:branched-chain amino acid aminotransferase
LKKSWQQAALARSRKCGVRATAAAVSLLGTLGYKGEDVLINGGEIGDVTRRLYDAITGLQYGRSNDPHGWTSIVRKG